jgi:hypothetical protein
MDWGAARKHAKTICHLSNDREADHLKSRTLKDRAGLQAGIATMRTFSR